MFLMRIFFVLLFFFSVGYAQDEEVTVPTKEQMEQQQIAQKVTNLKKEVAAIDKELANNNWMTRYNNYLTYREIEKELNKIKADAKKYDRWKGEKYKELSYQLFNKIKIKENELELISEYKDSPIGRQISPPAIEAVPEVTNPFAIIEAMSFVQQLLDNSENYKQTKKELQATLVKLQTKKDLLQKINEIEKDEEIKKEIENLNRTLKDFTMVVDIVSTTDEVYTKKVQQITQEVHNSITEEGWHIAKILLIIMILFAISLAVKRAFKEYIDDEDKHYTTNKFINFIFIVLVIFIVLFSYIDNVSYLVTILGFASAGIAIALKDWFMSIFGWMAIMTSGAISVGDRIKVVRDKTEVVGDVLDISLFKIAVREDITLTTYMTNRRAGRVFFIPNNYIFTDMISNYTFDQLRTVWDGIDIYITFDSNHQRAI
jgi:uncharacterized membrane protein